jgi:23S rRNA (guanosine2251-2'-O)-methyltransferase
LRGRRSHRTLFIANGIKEDARIKETLAAANKLNVPVERVDRQVLDALTGNGNHQGVGLATSPYAYVSLDAVLDGAGPILVLDHVQDPQNVGTLLRSADASGAAGVVFPQNRAADVTPAVVNASAGAVEHVLVTRQPNIARTLETLKEAGRWALALDTGSDAVDLFSAELPQPAALVVGAEGGGVSQLVRRTCDLVVVIPMTGQVASLNAATAGSIALFELMRRNLQQR